MSLESIFQSFPEIVTRNLILRRINPVEAKNFFEIMSDEQVMQYYDDETFENIQQAADQIAAWENGYQARRTIRWGIHLKDDDRLIGTCGFYGIHPWHRRAGIGYELGRSHWRKGIMTEALQAIIETGFREMGLNRIEAVVMPENLASIKLLEKLGFWHEGTLKEYENWGKKGFTDLGMYCLLRKAWRFPGR
jgi:ribosomal-protein-alanine N-acetyltransferase